MRPSNKPSGQPSSSRPSHHPSMQPTTQPSLLPSMQPSRRPSCQPSRQPSSDPSRQPSIQPSSQPTCLPSSIPSGQPTTQPSTQPTSSSPTSVPTAGPSKYPTTSHPSLEGETQRPSRYPTARPSWDTNNYQSSHAYIAYTSNLTDFEGLYKDSLIFSTFSYKGVNVEGTCAAWQTFTRTALQMPFDDIFFSQVSAYYSIYDYSKHSVRHVQATCSRGPIVTRLIGALRSGGEYSNLCDGFTWRVFLCNGKPVLCINCKRVCVKSVACPGSSFITNPCQQPLCADGRIAAGAIASFQYQYKILYPQFVMKPSLQDVTRSSILIQFSTDKAGTVYCAAMEAYSMSTTLGEVYSQSAHIKVTNSASVAQLRMENLKPDTTYSVICYTEDFAQHSMTLSAARQSMLTATTQCCRYIYFSTTFPTISEISFYDTVSSIPRFSFILSNAPNSPVKVELEIFNYSCNSDGNQSMGSASSTVVPSSFRFTSTSDALQGSFTVQGYEGCYLIKSTATSNDYYLTSNITVQIINPLTTSAPAPTLQSSVFSADGSKLLVTFGAATNRPSSSNPTDFPCSVVLEFSDSRTASCRWTSGTVLTVYLNSLSTCRPGDILSVR